MNPTELQTGPPMEILIAEDSPTQARRLRHILEQQGFRVIAATNGRAALEMAKTHKPTLIISDVVMPEMDGYELCLAVKSNPALCDIPVILVTTMSSPEDVIRGLACRADNFILKPYDERYLLGRIQFVRVNREMRQTDQPGMGLEIFFNGQRHFITADRLQILNLLLSTYDAAVQRNHELSNAQDKLRESNAKLHQMAAELEDRVTQRTQELALTNENLRQTQQVVMQQERLRALGQMASGIAHDINNAITPVALYTQSLLETEPNLSPRGREYLQTIECAIDDVAATVARMKEFYRHRETQLTLTPVALNSLVEQVSNLTKARWSDIPLQRGIVIRMKMELAPKLPEIMGVESEIREALINLIFNALDAMPEGGALTLRTRAESGPASPEKPHASPEVIVEVIDTGIGMDEDTRRRCLEPFFTTKGERGTGLGLAMVYGIVQRHSAAIDIESAVGKGTTMRLRFRIPDEVVIEPQQPEPARAVPPSLRILVVDDDPLLLKSLRDTLQTDGHTVVTAGGGESGIQAFREKHGTPEAFNVVLTDLGMPNVDGRKVAAAVKEISPKTPVILLTGWGQRLAAEGDTPAGVDRIVNKPPKLHELRDVLAKCCSL